MKFDLFVLFLLAAGCAWFWFDSLRARERATALAREFCRSRKLQLLDGTASLAGLSLKRRHRGLSIERRYQFDFADTGSLRRKGLVIMLGTDMKHFLIDDNICEC